MYIHKSNYSDSDGYLVC